MGSASSVSMAYSEEDPSVNQRQLSRDGEETKTLIEDMSETGEGKGEKEKEEEEEEEEGEEECGLCRYIKKGECKDAFIEFDKCVDEAEKNGESDLTKCEKAMVMFKTCMYDNPVYYEPILTNEARAIAKMLNELQAEKEAILAGDAATIASLLRTEETPVLPAEAAAIAKAFRELEAEKQVGKKKE